MDVNDPSTFRVKSRWCLQGHLDPDLDQKLDEGLLQSPTLSQSGRMILMQLVASFGWGLQLKDIKGAFLEAGPLPERFRPLYARLPSGSVPSVDDNAVVEIVGNVYGQNDAPAAWHKAFDTAARSFGWERSLFDQGRLCVGQWAYTSTTPRLADLGQSSIKPFANSKIDSHTENGVFSRESSVVPFTYKTPKPRRLQCHNRPLPKRLDQHILPREPIMTNFWKNPRFEFSVP